MFFCNQLIFYRKVRNNLSQCVHVHVEIFRIERTPYRPRILLYMDLLFIIIGHCTNKRKFNFSQTKVCSLL
jgi:hypothetical protein